MTLRISAFLLVMLVAASACNVPSRAEPPAAELTWSETGDALLDAYGTAVLERFNQGLTRYVAGMDQVISSNRLEHLRKDPQALGAALELLPEDALEPFFADVDSMSHPNTLPRETLAAWQARFGDDPRFYQLRYVVESGRWLTEDRDYSSFNPEEYAPLVEAYQRGVADGRTMLLFAGIYSVTKSTYVEDMLERQQEDRDAAVAEKAAGEDPYVNEGFLSRSRVDFEADRSAAIATTSALGLPAEEDLYKAVIALSPDWKEGYFAYAAFLSDSKRDDEALQMLRDGLAASDNSAITVFPLRELTIHVQQDKPVSPLVFWNATITQATTGDSATGFMAVRWTPKEVAAVSLAEAQDYAERVHTLLQAMLVEAQAPGYTASAHSLDYVKALRICRQASNNLGSYLDAEAAAELEAVATELKAVNEVHHEMVMQGLSAMPAESEADITFDAAGMLSTLIPLYNSSVHQEQHDYKLWLERGQPVLTRLVTLDLPSHVRQP